MTTWLTLSEFLALPPEEKLNPIYGIELNPERYDPQWDYDRDDGIDLNGEKGA